MWDQRFDEIVRRYLPFHPPGERLAENSSLRDLGLDSLGTVELLSVLEDTYRVSFTHDTLSWDTFDTPTTLWRVLSGMLISAD